MRSDVFQGLPASDDINAVADFCIAGYGTHLWIIEAMGERANRARSKQCIGIQRDYDFALRMAQTMIQSIRLTRILLGEESHARLSRKVFADDFTRGVGRPIVHNNDLKLFVVGKQQAGNRGLDHHLLVVRRNND